MNKLYLADNSLNWNNIYQRKINTFFFNLKICLNYPYFNFFKLNVTL